MIPSLIRSIKAYWPLSDLSAEARQEVTGHGDHLRIVGSGVPQVAGHITQAIQSPAGGAGYLSAPSSPNLALGGQSFSGWAWFRLTEVLGATSLLVKTQEYQLTFQAPGGAPAILLDLYYGLPNAFERLTFGPVLADTQYLALFVVDADAGTATLYVNNVEAASAILDTAIRSGDSDLVVGFSNSGNVIQEGTGLVAAALTSDERDAIWKAGAGRHYPFGTTAPRTREFGSTLANSLDSETLTLALLVKLERQDGTVFGFTTHDVDVTVGGVVYEALSSVQASALRTELQQGIDNLDVVGLLQSDRITEAELEAGVYDGAAITLYLIDWSDLSLGTAILMRGSLGAVTISDGQYVAELRSLGQRLQQSVGELTSPLCRVADFGDARCGLDVSDFTFSRTVAAVTDARHLVFDSDTHASGYYTEGKVRFASGANAGYTREVKTHTLASGQAVLVLQEGFPYPVVVGDDADLVAGCDRRRETCSGTFSNIINFRGEPYLPGTDQVLKRGRKA